MYELLLALPAPDAAPDGGGGGGGMSGMMIMLLPLLILFVLMPLFNKKDKKRRKKVQTLKKHDKIVTTGGIYGTVTALDEVSATVEIAKDVRIKIKRSSIYDIESPQDAKKQATEKVAAKS
ncbi:MAG: preprotein translocase subunit YajC [Planctomycetota bacterium]|jgi:preprotein translocase subunit YajC